MDSKKLKRHAGSDRPTCDEFHDILKQLAPNQTFTKGSVQLLRTAYFSYLDQVASTLVQHDKVTSKDDGIITTACSVNNTPEFVEWIQEAQTLLLSQKQTPNAAGAMTRGSHPKPTKASKKRATITAEMEAEQERLLRKSKDVMTERQVET